MFLTMNGKKVFDYNGGDLGPIGKADYGRNQDEIWVRQSFCFNLLSSFCQTCGCSSKISIYQRPSSSSSSMPWEILEGDGAKERGGGIIRL